MCPIIKNRDTLLDNSRSKRDLAARRLVLLSLEAALKGSDPAVIMKSNLRIKGSNLTVKSRNYDLSRFERILVVGGGKAAASMAMTLEQLLNDRITCGHVNILRGTKPRHPPQRIILNEASHPIPDMEGLKGVAKILEILRNTTSHDLVICLLSGGGSALMPYPIAEVSLRDKQLTTQIMLKSGATINELNCVRKHLSLVKGGGLAKAAFPATVLTLILSDVVGDPLDTIASAPTFPDSSTFASAISVLNNRGVWRLLPESVRRALKTGADGNIPETPKEDDKVFRKVTNIIIGNNRTACMAAAEHAKEMGAKSIFLTSLLEGEAEHVGTVVCAIARELQVNNGNSKSPTVVVMGGETTVTVTGTGRGGRNQQMMLSASLKLGNSEGIAIASMGTDGLDGNSPAAGAIVDGNTIQRADRLHLKPADLLRDNDSYKFFNSLHDTIVTGATGTNLNDVTIGAIVRSK